MTRRVTTTRRSAARDMTKALLHAGAEPPVGRHCSTDTKPGPKPRAMPAPPARPRVRRTMPKM